MSESERKLSEPRPIEFQQRVEIRAASWDITESITITVSSTLELLVIHVYLLRISISNTVLVY